MARLKKMTSRAKAWVRVRERARASLREKWQEDKIGGGGVEMESDASK
jgi:hypothetical protein